MSIFMFSSNLVSVDVCINVRSYHMKCIEPDFEMYICIYNFDENSKILEHTLYMPLPLPLQKLSRKKLNGSNMFLWKSFDNLKLYMYFALILFFTQLNQYFAMTRKKKYIPGTFISLSLINNLLIQLPRKIRNGNLNIPVYIVSSCIRFIHRILFLRCKVFFKVRIRNVVPVSLHNHFYLRQHLQKLPRKFNEMEASN